MQGRLAGKVAVVTGASRGIGRATAILFAREGASVCINYSSSEKQAKEVHEKIRELGGHSMAMRADVAEGQQVDTMMQRVNEEFGAIHILVNNAGISIRGEAANLNETELYKMFEVNVMGIANCARSAAKYMIRNGYGKIVNVASNAGIGTALTGTSPYAITKAAAIILTKRLALELGPQGVYVNAVAPGYTRTDLTTGDKSAEEFERIVNDLKQKTILRRIAEPDEIANVILFLASDESSFMTGQVITADGGRTDYLTRSM